MANLKNLPKELAGIPLGAKQWERFQEAGLTNPDIIAAGCSNGTIAALPGVGEGRIKQIMTWLGNGGAIADTEDVSPGFNSGESDPTSDVPPSQPGPKSYSIQIKGIARSSACGNVCSSEGRDAMISSNV